MMNFHDQPHTGEPANVAFMHFPAGAMRIGIFYFKLIFHNFLSLKALCIFREAGIDLMPQASLAAIGQNAGPEIVGTSREHYTLTTSKAPDQV
jgi:hypothetical protein